MKKIIFISFLLFFACIVKAQFIPASYQIYGKELKYQIMFPEGYTETKTYPLLIFLHGSGERGSDNQKQLIHGKQFLIDNFYAKYPAIVIVPQCPEDDYWTNIEQQEIGDKSTFNFNVGDQMTSSMSILIHLISNWKASGKIDKSKMYVGGLSMGGMGTLELLWRMPRTFAGAFSICGGTNLKKLSLFAKNTSVWLFHGDKDNVVPVENSRNAAKKLKALGCNVKYTEYKGANHNSWDSTFAEKNLPSWLFSQRLSSKKN